MSGVAGDSIFAKIVRGDIPCQRVFENEYVLAFLDIAPLSEGHTLVIPKRPVERLEDLPPEEVGELVRQLSPLAQRICEVVGAEGYNILQNNGEVAGQEVPYVHFHIIPRRSDDGLGYRWKSKSADPDKLAHLAQRIAAH